MAISSRSGYIVSEFTHRDVVEFIEQFKLNEPRHVIKNRVVANLAARHKESDDDYIAPAECLIALATRVWLLCKINLIGEEARHDQRIARWDSGGLRDFLADYLPRKGKLRESVRLEKQFQAHNLERLGGLKILWSENLLDHLRVHDPSHLDEETCVSIFFHAQLLKYHQQSNDAFPTGLMSETLNTLALLFPRHDFETQKWFKEQCALHCLDPVILLCDPLDPEERTLESFEYWRDRLIILKRAYDEAEPKNVTQWWFDRRKRVQWATFWVAALVLALTVVFGIIQSIEGALQAYKAYHPS